MDIACKTPVAASDADIGFLGPIASSPETVSPGSHISPKISIKEKS